MQSFAQNPDDYTNELPPDRKEAVLNLRNVIRENLPEGFEETINYGMIGYVVPHKIYPKGYHTNPKMPLPFISIASQKNFISFYHMGVYANKNLLDWLVSEYKKTGFKLDMGKSCIRFKTPGQIPYELIGKLCSKITCNEWISLYELNLK